MYPVRVGCFGLTPRRPIITVIMEAGRIMADRPVMALTVLAIGIPVVTAEAETRVGAMVAEEATE